MAILEVEHINKTFGRTEVLKDISFSLERGQVLSLIGSSGSGKTTLLRCLNFLETPDKGVIRVNDELLFDAANPVTKQESEIRKKRLHFGLVFQSFNLFPQYTALGNVMLAKELLAKSQPDYKARKKEIHAEIEAEAKRLLDQMGLSERMNNYPHQLSGGQCQRVAIARALALSPDILCFDEPTSALDPEMVGEVLEVMKDHMYVIEIANEAIKTVGIPLVSTPVRGGTDGARLSYMGLPCPNLGTGGYGFHGPYEHITVEGMEHAVKIIKEIVKHPVEK